MGRKRQRILDFLVIIIISSVMIYTIYHYFGTNIVLFGYGISEKNAIIDKTYDLFAHDTKADVNKTRTRLIVYSDNDEKDSLNALVFLYSKKNSRLLSFAKLKIGENQVDVEDHNFILSGDTPVDYIQLPEAPNFVTVIFTQYNNIDPLLPLGNDQGDDLEYEGKED